MMKVVANATFFDKNLQKRVVITMNNELTLIFWSNFSTFYYDMSKNIIEESDLTGEKTIIDISRLVMIAKLNNACQYLPDFVIDGE